MTETTLATISDKIDSLAANHALMIVFTETEVAAIKASVQFTEAFHNDPATLNRMAAAFTAAEGWVKITRLVLILLGISVVSLTQWDRLREIIAGWAGR